MFGYHVLGYIGVTLGCFRGILSYFTSVQISGEFRQVCLVLVASNRFQVVLGSLVGFGLF